MTDSVLAQRVLMLSTVLSGVLGAFALAVGLVSGSMSIIFDGLFSIIDVTMGFLHLDTQVNSVMDSIVARHGFAGYTSCAAKVGRGAFIEVHILVHPNWRICTMAEVRSIRNEIAGALGPDHDHAWLTVDFRASESWM